MKKAFYLLAAAATLMFAASCNKEVAEETYEATFRVNLEQAQTKATVFSDGHSATKLQVLVYSTTDGYLPSVSLLTEEIHMTREVNLKLVKGKTYEIVFWAQNEAGPYTINPAAATMTVTTVGKANDEARDAFYKLYNTGKVTGPINETIELRRPFAQINVYTTNADFEAAKANNVKFTESSMKITAPTVLNLRTGDVSTPVEYNLTNAPMDVDATPAIDGYKYIAMNYVLAATRESGNPELTTVKFGVYTDDTPNPAALLNECSVANVPYQRNYRTNIMGDIFSVNGKFNVIIIPEYDGEHNFPFTNE